MGGRLQETARVAGGFEQSLDAFPQLQILSAYGLQVLPAIWSGGAAECFREQFIHLWLLVGHNACPRNLAFHKQCVNGRRFASRPFRIFSHPCPDPPARRRATPWHTTSIGQPWLG